MLAHASPSPARVPREGRNVPPTLYYNPENGDLRDEIFEWALPLEKYTVGVTAPLFVRCQLHGKVEIVDNVTTVPSIPNHALLLGFARALLAASHPSCAEYRARAGRLAAAAYIQAVNAEPRAVRPLRSYTLLEDLLGVSLAAAVAALAALSVPTLPTGITRLAYGVVLDRVTGELTIWRSETPVRRHLIPLPADGQWLLAPCRAHGWDYHGTLPKGATTALVSLGRVMLAAACTSCEDYRARASLLTLPSEIPASGSSPLGVITAFIETAALFNRVSQNVGWVVARHLSAIADALGNT